MRTWNPQSNVPPGTESCQQPLGEVGSRLFPSQGSRWMNCLASSEKPMCDFSGLIIGNSKALPGRPLGGKLPFPHQTWCMGSGLQSLRELYSRTQPLWPVKLSCILCSLLPGSLYLRSSPGTSAKASLWGKGGHDFAVTCSLWPCTQYFPPSLLSLHPHPKSPRGYKIPSTVRCI